MSPEVSQSNKTSKPSVSARKAEANRQNALQSTGPKTLRGKAFSRKNALKDGLFARELLVDSLIKREDREKFFRIHAGLREAWQPVGQAEDLEVEFIAVCWYKRARVWRYEMRKCACSSISLPFEGKCLTLANCSSQKDKSQILLLEKAQEQLKTSGEVQPELRNKIFNEDPWILSAWPKFEKEAEKHVRKREEQSAREVAEATALTTKVKHMKPGDPASCAKRARTLEYLAMHFAIQNILKWTEDQYQYVLDGMYDQLAIPNRDALDRI